MWFCAHLKFWGKKGRLNNEKQLAISPSTGFKDNLNQLKVISNYGFRKLLGKKMPQDMVNQESRQTHPESLAKFKKLFLDFKFYRI